MPRSRVWQVACSRNVRWPHGGLKKRTIRIGENDIKMSYDLLEAKLVNDILDLRASEDALARSLAEWQSKPADAAADAIAREFDRIQRRLSHVEQLINDMDQARVAVTEAQMQFVPTPVSARQTAAAYQA